MIRCFICLIVGYFCGSLLTAEGVARRFAGRSIFELGDGNPGMANVGHELGKRAAIICLVGDILKTLIPVIVLRILFPNPGFKIVTAWTGVGSTLGHLFPFWHGFKGGKGVTTIATTIILMNPLWGILAGVVGIVTIILSGYLSVGAVVAIIFYACATFWTDMPWDCRIAAIIFVLLTIRAHGSKLRGIKDGTTRKASLSTKFWERFKRS